MLRVRNSSCKVHPDFSQDIKECFSEYASDFEDTHPFGPASKIKLDVNGTWPLKSSRSAWTFNSFKNSQFTSSSNPGLIASYSGGGFIQDLSMDKAESLAIIGDLKKHLWLNRASRVLFIDFTVYNANVNLFCQIRLMAEFPATGGLITSSTFRTIRLLRLESALEHFLTACQIMFCIFIVYYIVEEAIEIVKKKASYFKFFMNWMDLVVILLGLVCIGANIYTAAAVSLRLENLLKTPSAFPDFELLGYCSATFNNALAVLVFAAWIKIFKYISFNKTMNQLSLTLTRCTKDLAGFSLMFFIIFLAFCQLAYLVFGSQVKTSGFAKIVDGEV
jgi:polycystin 2